MVHTASWTSQTGVVLSLAPLKRGIIQYSSFITMKILVVSGFIACCQHFCYLTYLVNDLGPAGNKCKNK